MSRIEIEEWIPVKGFEGYYEVSNLGRVKSVERIDCNNRHLKERILKPIKHTCGYLTVLLCKDGKVKGYGIHRLVANSFLPNPKNLTDVNHINEIKTDNRLSNLEWMNHRDNIRYSQSKTVNQYSKDGRFIKTWDCIIEVQNQLGFCQTYISACCKGKHKYAYGYQWFYSDDLRQPEPPLF